MTPEKQAERGADYADRLWDDANVKGELSMYFMLGVISKLLALTSLGIGQPEARIVHVKAGEILETTQSNAPRSH